MNVTRLWTRCTTTPIINNDNNNNKNNNDNNIIEQFSLNYLWVVYNFCFVSERLSRDTFESFDDGREKEGAAKKKTPVRGKASQTSIVGNKHLVHNSVVFFIKVFM